MYNHENRTKHDMHITIMETPEFISRAKKVLTEEELVELIDYLAAYPTAGNLIKGTGGMRKLRWSRKGIGKRGGARIIYFFYSDSMPLVLLALYVKSEKDDLSEREKQSLKQSVDILIKEWTKG